MEQNIQTFTAMDGAEIKYIDEGEGTPVLYIYGIGSSIASAAPFIQVMREHCRIIVFDQRAFGLTEGVGEMGIHQSARDAQALIEHLGLKKTVLLGYSLGAAVVFSYVEQFGCDRLEKIVIGDMSPKLINEDGWDLGLYQGHYTREHYEQDLVELKTNYRRWSLILTEQLLFQANPQDDRDFTGDPEAIIARIEGRGPNPLIKQALFTGLVDITEDHQRHNYHYWVTMASADFRPVLKTITVPTALIYADPGSGYQPATAVYMHEQIPDSVLMPMEGCSHMAASENAPQYFKYLFDFCNI